METAKTAIIDQAKDATKKGAAKKFIVDEQVIASINILKESCKNGLIRWLLNKIIDVVLISFSF